MSPIKKLSLHAVICGVALNGCAMSAAGIGKGAVERQWTSNKSAQQVAGCLAASLVGSNPVFEEVPGRYVVLRNNGYGVPTVRYDVFAGSGVTQVELRSTIKVNRGIDKVERCL